MCRVLLRVFFAPFRPFKTDSAIPPAYKNLAKICVFYCQFVCQFLLFFTLFKLTLCFVVMFTIVEYLFFIAFQIYFCLPVFIQSHTYSMYACKTKRKKKREKQKTPKSAETKFNYSNLVPGNEFFCFVSFSFFILSLQNLFANW